MKPAAVIAESTPLQSQATPKALPEVRRPAEKDEGDQRGWGGGGEEETEKDANRQEGAETNGPGWSRKISEERKLTRG